MEQKKPKGFRYVMFKAAVLSLSLLLASVSVAGCLLGDLQAEFPDSPTWVIQMFITFPTIGGMIANVIGGAMAAKVGKKNLCLIGIAMCFIGGFVPMFMPTLMLKVLIRCIAGLGVGLIQPLSASLIVDCFEGKEANTMMGFQSSCVGLGASIFSYTMAAIMVYDWHFAYFAYLYAAAIFVLVLIFIPSYVNDIGRGEKKESPITQTENPAVKKKASKLPVAAFIGMVLQFMYGLGYGAIDNCISLGAVETGAITTVQAAAIASWGGVAALLGGLIFGKVKDIIGMKVGGLSIILNAVGFLIIASTSNVTMWYIGITIAKVGFCWWMPYVNFMVNDGTDETNSALATSLGFFGNSLGAFVFSYVLAGIGALFGGISSHNAFYYAAVWMIPVMIGVLIYSSISKKKAKEA